MPTRVVSLRQSPTYVANPPSVFGSKRAGVFLQDLLAGRDSLDVVLLGDSNCMRNDYGYAAGWNRALEYICGSSVYATPICAGNVFLIGAPVGAGLTRFRGDYGFGTGVGFTMVDDNYTNGRVGTLRTLVHAAAGGDTHASTLKAFLGFDSTNYTDDATTRLPRPLGWQWGGAYVPATVGTGTTNYYSSYAADTYLEVSSRSQLNYGTGTGGSALQYRVVYGTFGSGSGQFTLRTRDVSNPNTSTDGPTYQTNAAVGYATGKMNFTTQSSTLNSVRCYWDGFTATQAQQAKGPVAVLWQSVIRQSGKGHSVNPLIGHSGMDTTGIANRVEYMDKLLDSYLKEIFERQREAGGTGRAIVFMNSGINDVSPSTNWTPAAQRIVARMQQRWTAIGGNIDNLAFVFSVTHATTAQGAWDTARAATATAANTWATSNAGLNATVVDLAQNYPGTKMLNGVAGAGGSLFDGAGSAQAHLSTALTQLNGYDAMAGNVVSALLASV